MEFWPTMAALWPVWVGLYFVIGWWCGFFYARYGPQGPYVGDDEFEFAVIMTAWPLLGIAAGCYHGMAGFTALSVKLARRGRKAPNGQG
jgi:hypothetical protein